MRALFEKNLLLDGHYVEPYAGGAGVGLALLINEYVSKIIINDIDRSIYAFWHSVLNRTEELSKLIVDTPLNVDTWRRQRDVQKNKSHDALLILGFSTFYLNRTNRSGIIAGGLIGGLQQSGPWKMDCRYNKRDLVQRIQKIASYQGRIMLQNLDAIDFLKMVMDGLPSRSLIYLDPPYFCKGSKLYVNYYSEEDHSVLSKFIKRMTKYNWVVTYDDVDQIKSLYHRFYQLRYSLSYSAAEKSLGREVMIFSDKLTVPAAVRRMLHK